MHGKMPHVAQNGAPGLSVICRSGNSMVGAGTTVPAQDLTPLPLIDAPQGAVLVQAARIELRMQRHRPLFEAPHIFDYQPWRLMLEVFVANHTNRRFSVTDACLVLGGAQTTAMRCLAMIERHGLLVGAPDPRDARRRLLRLSSGSDRVVSRYLAQISSMNESVIRGDRPDVPVARCTG